MHSGNTLRAVTVLVVDEHAIVRQSVAALLEERPEIHVIGTAASGAQALYLARQLQPDVVVMDIALHDSSGVDIAPQILRDEPRTRVVILSVCHAAESVFRALRAGAHAYVLKQSASAELADAVMAVLQGERYLSPPISEMLHRRVIGSAPRSPLEYLSAREREVLRMTMSGATSTEIARRLLLSPKTVETYRSRIRDKFGVADHAALIRFALKHSMSPS
jgi:two-component system, NarL family, response regulator NreC